MTKKSCSSLGSTHFSVWVCWVNRTHHSPEKQLFLMAAPPESADGAVAMAIVQGLSLIFMEDGLGLVGESS